MERERWQKVKRICEDALELEAGKREGFLTGACRGDAALRRDVDSFLSGGIGKDGFIETPAFEMAAKEMAEDETAADFNGKSFLHYRIVEKIGAGGMGVVYRARDERLNRYVAIKVMPEILMKDPERLARFRREAQAASATNHPNICTIYDINEHEGRLFIAMEFLEGQNLKQRISAKRIDTEEILDLAIQIADGLDAAHTQGIIHRDIKSANIFTTRRGQAKILDFGLAKLLSSKAGAKQGLESTTGTAEQELTNPGAAMGTPAYMSPEQTLGKELDARTDLFSLGVVLYEMATGVLPFRGATSAATFNAILNSAPTAPVRINPELPGELERIINKALEKDRNLRYQSASDMRADIQRLKRDSDLHRIAAAGEPPRKTAAKLPRWKSLVLVTAVAALALAVGLNLGGLRDRLFGKAVTPRIESLAVLPLENLSGDPNQEVFTNGMTEALITELSKIKALKKVISRRSVMQYKGIKKPIKQIAEELGVDALIEGSALREGDKVRITVQVIAGATDAHLWADTFDREYRNILSLHSDVARAIAREVNAALSPEEAATLARRGTVNPEAYDCFLRANERWAAVKALDLRIAIQLYEKAIELDPGFALAYANMSAVHSMMWWNSVDRTEERISLAKAAVDKALQLQPDLPETHRALGLYYYWCRMDLARSLSELEEAQRMMPNDATNACVLGLLLRRQGKRERSIVYLTKAYELDPTSAEYASQAALTYASAGKSKEAIRYYDIAIRLSPDLPGLYAQKAFVILNSSDDPKKARSALEPALRLGFADDPLLAYSRAFIDMREGTIQEAIQRVSSESWEAVEGQENYIPRALLLAQLCGLAGQPQQERNFFEAAVQIIAGKIKQRPEKAAYHSALGIAYAGLRRKQEAIREGKAGMELKPVSKDAGGYYQVLVLAQIYAKIGEDDEALRLLEYLVSNSRLGAFSSLRRDPEWKPLRNHPRFQALLRKYGD